MKKVIAIALFLLAGNTIKSMESYKTRSAMDDAMGPRSVSAADDGALLYKKYAQQVVDIRRNNATFHVTLRDGSEVLVDPHCATVLASDGTIFQTLEPLYGAVAFLHQQRQAQH